MQCFVCSERELADEEEDLYDSVPEAEDGIYGTIIDLKPSKAAPKVRFLPTYNL